MSVDQAPPGLEFLFTARGQLAPPIQLGRTPNGERTVVPVLAGGRFEGPRLSGHMLEGAADVQRIREDGVVELEAHGVLETDDGVRILYRNSGLRWFPDEVAAAMREGRPFDPARVYSRAIPRFEAPMDSPYAWLNRALFLSVPARDAQGIKLTVWQVLEGGAGHGELRRQADQGPGRGHPRLRSRPRPGRLAAGRGTAATEIGQSHCAFDVGSVERQFARALGVQIWLVLENTIRLASIWRRSGRWC